jgi:hypothetical protein
VPYNSLLRMAEKRAKSRATKTLLATFRPIYGASSCPLWAAAKGLRQLLQGKPTTPTENRVILAAPPTAQGKGALCPKTQEIPDIRRRPALLPTVRLYCRR